MRPGIILSYSFFPTREKGEEVKTYEEKGDPADDGPAAIMGGHVRLELGLEGVREPGHRRRLVRGHFLHGFLGGSGLCMYVDGVICSSRLGYVDGPRAIHKCAKGRGSIDLFSVRMLLLLFTPFLLLFYFYLCVVPFSWSGLYRLARREHVTERREGLP